MTRDHEAGYTLVEVLTALVLLFIVLIPTSYVISYLLTDSSGRDHIVAANLAERTMEETLLHQTLSDLTNTRRINNVEYRIEQRVANEGSLLRIDVQVFREKSGKPIVSLYRYRFNPE